MLYEIHMTSLASNIFEFPATVPGPSGGRVVIIFPNIKKGSKFDTIRRFQYSYNK